MAEGIRKIVTESKRSSPIQDEAKGVRLRVPQLQFLQLVPGEIIKIRPDGELYLPATYIVSQLEKAYGMGGWALRNVRSETADGVFTAYFTFFVDDKCLADGVRCVPVEGGNPYSVVHAYNEAKEQALNNCLLFLGFFEQLRNIQFILDWKKENALEVTCIHATSMDTAHFWRKKNTDPLRLGGWTEKGLVASKPYRRDIAIHDLRETLLSIAAKNTAVSQEEEQEKTQFMLHTISGKNSQNEELLVQFLFGKTHTSELHAGECEALQRWLKVDKVGQVFLPDPQAQKEFQALIKYLQP